MVKREIRETDYIHQIAGYIRKNLLKGYTIDSLKFSLQDQGYGRSEILRAIKIANDDLSKQVPKLVEKPVIKVERVPVKEEHVEIKSFFKRFLGK